MHTKTHEATVRDWFSIETISAAWKAADPAACTELAQLLRDKVLKAYKMGLLDGAARRTSMLDQAIMDADNALGECLLHISEVQYLASEITIHLRPCGAATETTRAKAGNLSTAWKSQAGSSSDAVIAHRKHWKQYKPL